MTIFYLVAASVIITSVVVAVAAFLIDKPEKATVSDIPPRWILDLAYTEILLDRAERMLGNAAH